MGRTRLCAWRVESRAPQAVFILAYLYPCLFCSRTGRVEWAICVSAPGRQVGLDSSFDLGGLVPFWPQPHLLSLLETKAGVALETPLSQSGTGKTLTLGCQAVAQAAEPACHREVGSHIPVGQVELSSSSGSVPGPRFTGLCVPGVFCPAQQGTLDGQEPHTHVSKTSE